ncbi:hypothetical protein ACH4VM_33825 [Streptomyces sp. NPDC020792]|uniref:hypothetical protein n=1 Tax=Streptomyces sp. NPDC020792 TaxID=3365089 RepID=UPI0037BB34FE
MITMMASAPLTGGLIDDLEREDDERGFEPDETEGQFLRVLIPHGLQGSVGTGPKLPSPHGSGQWQCDRCGGWFGVSYWTCNACQALGQLIASVRKVR